MLPNVFMMNIVQLVIIISCLDNIHSATGAQLKTSHDDTVIFEQCIPHFAKVNCSFLPSSFIDCDPPIDLKGNHTELAEKGYGCLKFGGWRYEDVLHTAVQCRALDGIECCGSRSFFRRGVPCVKYNGHYFATTLIYSLLLGFLGLDRFCLGLTGTAVGKLLTLGGVGIWWLVDIVLLITGSLTPEDGSNWNTNV